MSCGRRVDGAGEVKVEIFRPLYNGNELAPGCEREMTYKVRGDRSDDSTDTNRCKITGKHLVISSAGLRSSFSIGTSPMGMVVRLAVTLMTLLLRVAVVTSQAMIPATNPATEPPMHPHLFAFFHVMANAIGTTALPKMTPMNVCGKE